MQEEKEEEVRRGFRRWEVIFSTFLYLYVFFSSLHESFKFIEMPKQIIY